MKKYVYEAEMVGNTFGLCAYIMTLPHFVYSLNISEWILTLQIGKILLHLQTKFSGVEHAIESASLNTSVP